MVVTEPCARLLATAPYFLQLAGRVCGHACPEVACDVSNSLQGHRQGPFRSEKTSERNRSASLDVRCQQQSAGAKAGAFQE